MLPKFPVIVGPTAGGKSALAMRLCESLAQQGGRSGEIVSADSMQVFRGLDVGTAKPTRQQRARIRHHLIDIRDPNELFSVDRWLELAQHVIDDIRARCSTPVVVGGTHLYVQSLLYGLFDGPPANEPLRAELADVPIDELRAMLVRSDPEAASRFHPNDRRRAIRAIEVFRATGSPLSGLQREWEGRPPRPDAMLVGLEWPLETINQRINARVRAMIDAGLVEETRRLWQDDRFGQQAREALGYKQLIEHLEGRLDLVEAIERIKIETRRFAKNQRTWLRRLRTTPDSTWVDGGALVDPMGAQITVNQILEALGANPGESS